MASNTKYDIQEMGKLYNEHIRSLSRHWQHRFEIDFPHLFEKEEDFKTDAIKHETSWAGLVNSILNDIYWFVVIAFIFSFLFLMTDFPFFLCPVVGAFCSIAYTSIRKFNIAQKSGSNGPFSVGDLVKKSDETIFGHVLGISENGNILVDWDWEEKPEIVREHQFEKINNVSKPYK